MKSDGTERTMLEFPNARLLIHNALADGCSGSGALVRGAYEYNLVPPGSCQDVAKLMDNGSCHCLPAAKTILHRHFESPSCTGSKPVDFDALWDNVELQLANYQKSTKNVKGHHNCERFAPILFDLVLQEIRRYS